MSIFFICGVFLVGCSNRTLQGDWLAVDGMAAPPGMARLDFVDSSQVQTTDGLLQYRIVDDQTMEIKMPSGQWDKFAFERQGDNLLLSRADKRIAYARQP